MVVELKSDMKYSSIELSSLNDKVTIRRDERGIPYIEASNEADLYLAQGYATAFDRLWQMDFLRRTARGELSEILGRNAIEQDKLHRLYGFTKLAERLLAHASTQTRVALESYARGVNTFIEGCGSLSLPREFHILAYTPRAWTAVDSLALGKLLAESLSVTVDVDILRALLRDLPAEKLAALLPETSPHDVVIVDNIVKSQNRPPAAERSHVPSYAKIGETERTALTELLGAMRRTRAATGVDGHEGSNGWAVSGRLTASGKPMLANDPHLPPTSPTIWHITHLCSPELEVSGVSIPGLPGVMIGHNKHIAWGITNLCPDVQDLYLEKFDENDPCVYLTPGGWRQAEVNREEIKVRQSANGSADETVTLEVKVTRHGPIHFESGSLGLAVRWTALDSEVIDLESFLAINRARNWSEFVNALSGFAGPPQNFVYADTAGHIGYHVAGRIPVRKTGDGSLPYDGTTDDGEWLGSVPFEELPQVFDPPSGIIVSANQRSVSEGYPHHLSHNWRTPYRARRIHDLLKMKPKLTIDDFLAIQADTYSYPDAIFASAIVELAEPLTSSSAEWREMANLLDGWEGYSTSESRELPIVTEMRKAFRQHILVEALGRERAELFEWRNEGTFIDKLITERPLAWLPRGIASYESLILACYREARNTLTQRLGPDQAQWTWGRLAPVRFPHPLEKLGAAGSQFAVGTFPQHTGGSMPTVNAGGRVSMRFVADLSSWTNTRLCLPLGESGEPLSLHRDDQLAEWQKVTPRVLHFNLDAIANAACQVLLMTPK